MKITIVSSFRNAENYIQNYIDQMSGFKSLLEKKGHSLNLILGYGDSIDGTGEMLYESCAFHLPALIIGVNHGGAAYGSVVHPERFRQLAFVGNRLWGCLPHDSDVVGLIESDLLWNGDALVGLLEGLHAHQMVAPMVYDLKGNFYDTWAFRMGGIRFNNNKPFHPLFESPQHKGCTLWEMESVGSVFFMDANYARKITWPAKDVVVGFCQTFRELGGKIWLNSDVEVRHP